MGKQGAANNEGDPQSTREGGRSSEGGQDGPESTRS